MTESNNPFSRLLDADTKNPDHPLPGALQIMSKDEELTTVNNIVENVFHFTINPKAVDGPNKQLVYLEELAESVKPNIYIDLETMEQALFERILLTEPEVLVIPKSTKAYMDHVIQKQLFPYLFNAIQNIDHYEQNKNETVKKCVEKIKELIFRNVITALKQPALFEGQDFADQLIELLKHVDPQSNTFFLEIVNQFVADGK